MNPTQNKLCGIIAYFLKPSDLFCAAKKIRDNGFVKWDVFSPFPIHGMDTAMGLKRSKVPYFTLFCGITGFLTGMSIVWYMNAYDYPLVVAGKPFFSPIFPFPVFYELTILFAAFGTFFGMFLTNKLPRHHHPVFDVPGFEKVSDDTFCIYIQKEDPLFESMKTKTLLQEIGGKDIQFVYE